MSTVSSIDSSVYYGLLEGLTPIAPASAGSQSDGGVLREASIAPQESSVDLSNYYSNVMPGDVLQTVSENVVQAAHDLDNAMVSALQNGYSVQDAVNIQLAKSAYEANARVAKTTFELSI